LWLLLLWAQQGLQRFLSSDLCHRQGKAQTQNPTEIQAETGLQTETLGL